MNVTPVLDPCERKPMETLAGESFLPEDFLSRCFSRQELTVLWQWERFRQAISGATTQDAVDQAVLLGISWLRDNSS